MSKAKDILEKLKQRRETAETVRAYWAETLPDIGQLPEPQLQSWLGKFDLDAIIAGLDAAVTQRSKRDAKGEPMTAPEAVSFASAVMNRLHLEGLPEAEREALKATKDRIREARSAAGKRGNEKRWHSEPEVANPLPEVATTCDNLRPLATPLPPSYSVSVSSSVSPSSSHAAAPSADKSCGSLRSPAAKSEGKEKGKTNTNPSGTSGLSPDKTPKTKTIKTAMGEQPKPEGFDKWTNIQRTQWIACTCGATMEDDPDWIIHRRGCAALNGQAKAVGNDLGEPWL